MSKAERERAAQKVAVQWQAAITEYMREAIEQAVNEAQFSRETFFSFLRSEMHVERIEDLKREQFLQVCKMIHQLNEKMKT